jgi:hypothetical protein
MTVARGVVRLVGQKSQILPPEPGRGKHVPQVQERVPQRESPRGSRKRWPLSKWSLTKWAHRSNILMSLPLMTMKKLTVM